jgi:hypothetical protein
MTTQTEKLVKDWNGSVGDMLNSIYVLQGATQIAEVFDGAFYSRIHRRPGGMLIVEERKKGSMYPKAWELIQDFSEMEEALAKKMENEQARR